MAGKPIADAFELGESLEVAGCAFTPYSWSKVEETLTKGDELIADFIRAIAVECIVPCKSGKSRLLTMISFLPAGSKGNLREIVKQAFTAHKKEISEKVNAKFQNTVIMMEHMEHLVRS